ncbi:NBS-LRR type resistance protein [Cucumis melo var. makuwa]|uniref:NBS-LRR type resistance protein n=1 Tax=Cucumis melo var. makuwa TaxID=1194695 RepID=A0A5D3BRM1_CUCMM|nr:NBS-LRR type resistance protein [Cucumis melo var. makuwa]
MAFMHPFYPSPYPYLKSLKRKRNAHTNQSSDPVGCTYQTSDPEGCTYQSRDPKGYTYQSSDLEGYTYQSSDLEGCTYQSRDPEGFTYQSLDPEGCTYQSSDPEGYIYQSRNPKGHRACTTSSTQLSRLGEADSVSMRQWQHEHTIVATEKTARLPLSMTRRMTTETARPRHRRLTVGRARETKKKNGRRWVVAGCLRVAIAWVTTYEAKTKAAVCGALNGRGMEIKGDDNRLSERRNHRGRRGRRIARKNRKWKDKLGIFKKWLTLWALLHEP